MFNIAYLRVIISLSLPLFFVLITASCNEQYSTDPGYSHTLSYNCNDTLSLYNLSLYARVSSRYNYNTLPIIVLVTTPLGDRYADTLKLPVIDRGVEAQKVQSGIWRDYEWIYRRGIVFNKKGRWIFTVKKDTTLSLLLKGVGSMGVKVSQFEVEGDKK